MESMSGLIVRHATRRDIAGIISVIQTVYLQDEDWARQAIEQLLDLPNCTILVAELNGTIVGFIDYYVLPSIWEKWDEATINYLFVHKNYQGRGTGAALLEEVIKQTSKMGIGELHVGTKKDNTRALRLYRKHGFTKEYLQLERVREGAES